MLDKMANVALLAGETIEYDVSLLTAGRGPAEMPLEVDFPGP